MSESKGTHEPTHREVEVPCFVGCGAKLKAWLEPHGELSEVHDGVFFTTHGNWGSRILDMERSTVEIVICDACLIKKRDEIYVYKIVEKRERVAVDKDTVIPRNMPDES